MNRHERLITIAVFLLSLAVFSLARSRYVGLGATGPSQALLLTGDEPAYLMLTHSLVTDGDLNLYDNCVDRDGRFFGRPQSGGHSARTDREKEELYSIHTPGLAILLAPAYALGLYGPIAPRPAVCLFLNFLGALLAVNVYLYCMAVAGNGGVEPTTWRERSTALAATAAVVFTPPVIFYSNLAYPELPGALFILYALRHAISHPKGCATFSPSHRYADTPARRSFSADGPAPTQILASLAAAFLPWLSFRFLPVAVIITWLVSRDGVAETGRKRVARLFPCMALAVSLLFLLSYQYQAFGTINPAGGYAAQGWARSGYFNSGIVNGFLGIVLDQRYGLFAWSPVYILSITGLILLIRERRDRGLRLAIVVCALYLPGASFVHWWGGFSPPPRFTVAVAPLLGGALAYALARIPRRSFSILFGLLLIASLYFGYMGCMHPSMLYRRKHIISNYHPRLMGRIFPAFKPHRRSTWPLTALWVSAIVLLNRNYLHNSKRQK
jgi:hypothetical protein